MFLDIIAQRQFNTTYIILDSIFWCFFAFLLIYKKKYMTLIVGLSAGLLYMLVDYGIFHLLCHSRSISDGHSLFWTLLWMSMSYGFSNFVWIWLYLSKDKNIKEWSFLILLWWFVCPLLATTFGDNSNLILIQRTTGEYHGYMALILFVGYLGVIIWNLLHQEKNQRMRLLWLLFIGILVQFGWESALLIGGIRSATITSWSSKLSTLLINSLLETNLGIPYVYALYLLFSARFSEQLHKKEKKLSFTESLEENNTLSHGNS